MQSTDDSVVLSTAQLRVTIARKDSSVTFQGSAGKTLFEQDEISMTPTIVNGEQTYHAELYSKLGAPMSHFTGWDNAGSGTRGDAEILVSTPSGHQSWFA
jgi:hypothetical protein